MPDHLTPDFPFAPLPLTGSAARPGRPANYFEIAFHECHCPQVVLAAHGGTILDANAAAAQLLGCEASALPEKAFGQFLADEPSRHLLEQLLAVLTGGDLPPDAPLELRLRLADGMIVLVELNGQACRVPDAPDAVVLRLQDKSRQRLAEDLHWSEAPVAGFQYLVECLGDGFLVLNRQGVIVLANSTAGRILNQPYEQLIHQRFSEVFPGLDADKILRFVASGPAETQQTRQRAIQVPVQRNGEIRPFEFGIHPHRDGIGVLFRDVTRRVTQELEITKLNATMLASQELLRHKNDELNISLDQLAQMNKRLAQADRLKSEFLANTSHELRTPLNSIIGFLQLVTEGFCDCHEEETEYVQNAQTSAQHLLALINDVLDIAKIEAGKMTLLVDNIDLEELFQDLYSLTNIQAQPKGLVLQFEVRSETRRKVRADYHKVKQVLINLIGNSIKFTTEGWVRVWAESVPETPDMMLLCVQDTGIGVPLDKQQVIFEQFTQVDGTSTRRYQGTGLGLAISRNLVELMGGTLGIHSEGEDLGTTMSFTLPMGSILRCSAAGTDDPEAMSLSF